MLYVDVPGRDEIVSLNAARETPCVSIYLHTTPMSQQASESRAALRNAAKEALAQLASNGLAKSQLALLEEHLDDLASDDEFFRLQANSLAVLVTPDTVRTFRLANRLTPTVQVSDRFYIKPLLRAVTFSQSALILDISENAVRLIEIHSDLPPNEVKVDGLPKDAASAVRKSTLGDRSPSGRIQGSEGKNVRLRQYARRVDEALRPILAGRSTPLVLSAHDRMDSIFRSICSYAHVLPGSIPASTGHTGLSELADAARGVLDEAHAREIADVRELYQARSSDGRAVSQLSDAARAATFGAIQTVMVDIDAELPGLIDETDGTITFADAPGADSYDLVDEIAGRALATGARILAVRKDDLPVAGSPLAAILRYPV